MQMRTRLMTGTAVVLAGQLAGASMVLGQEENITIGLAYAKSGWSAAYDADPAEAVKMWIKERNAKGGLLGKQIAFVESDTKSDRAQGARAAQDVIDQGANMVVVPCDYDLGAAAAATAQRAGLVSMFLCAEDAKAGVQGAGAYAFTSSGAAQIQGASVVSWAQAELDVATVYSLLDSTLEYNKSVCGGADWAIANNPALKSVGSDTFKNDDATIQSQITHILSLPEKPDAIMLCSYVPGGASAVRQLRAAGLDMPILNGSTMDGTFWTDSVPNLKNVYVSVQASMFGDDPRAEVNSWFERFAATVGHPATNSYAILPYAFLDLWADAITKVGGTDAETVVKELESGKSTETILGKKSFSPELHIQANAQMVILGYGNQKPSVAGQYTLAEPIPFNVMFRMKQ